MPTFQSPLPPATAALAMADNSLALQQQEHDCLMKESLKERMEVMFWQEASQYRTKDYLANCTSSGADSGDGGEGPDREGVMSEQWRTRMCEWAYQLVDHFELPRDIVGTCTNLLDRYLATYFSATASQGQGAPAINKKEFQLVTMCCLYLAMKLKGQTRVPLEYMVQLSRGTMNVKQLQDMEMELLTQLAWLVNPPTAYDFLKHYLQLLQPTGSRSNFLQDMDGAMMLKTPPRLTALEDLAAFLVELSVLDYYFVNFRPSTVALAALFNAMDDDPAQFPQSQSQNPFLQFKLCHGYDGLILPGEEHNVFLCRQRLGSLYHNTAGSNTTTEQVPESPCNTGTNKKSRTTSPVSVTNMLQQ